MDHQLHLGPLIFLLIVIAWIWQSVRRVLPTIREGAAGTQAIPGPAAGMPAAGIPLRRPPPLPPIRAAARPAPPPPAPAPVPRPVPSPAVARRTNERAVVGVLRSPTSIGTAVVVAEILAPPVALR